MDDINIDGPGTVEDRATSLIFVGRPGVQVELYNKPNDWTGEGAFTVFASHGMITTIDDLDNNKDDHMSTSPAHCAYINHPSDSGDGFDDNLSSISFGEKMGGGDKKDRQRERCLTLTP